MSGIGGLTFPTEDVCCPRPACHSYYIIQTNEDPTDPRYRCLICGHTWRERELRGSTRAEDSEK